MPPKRKMRDEWLLNEEFSPWLTRVEGDPEKAFCSMCNKELNAELSTIKRHKVRADWLRPKVGLIAIFYYDILS